MKTLESYSTLELQVQGDTGKWSRLRSVRLSDESPEILTKAKTKLRESLETWKKDNSGLSWILPKELCSAPRGIRFVLCRCDALEENV